MSFDDVFEHLQSKEGITWASLYLYFDKEGVKVEFSAGGERITVEVDKFDRIFQNPLPLNDIPSLIMEKIK